MLLRVTPKVKHDLLRLVNFWPCDCLDSARFKVVRNLNDIPLGLLFESFAVLVHLVNPCSWAECGPLPGLPVIKNKLMEIGGVWHVVFLQLVVHISFVVVDKQNVSRLCLSEICGVLVQTERLAKDCKFILRIVVCFIDT